MGERSNEEINTVYLSIYLPVLLLHNIIRVFLPRVQNVGFVIALLLHQYLMLKRKKTIFTLRKIKIIVNKLLEN